MNKKEAIIQLYDLLTDMKELYENKKPMLVCLEDIEALELILKELK